MGQVFMKEPWTAMLGCLSNTRDYPLLGSSWTISVWVRNRWEWARCSLPCASTKLFRCPVPALLNAADTPGRQPPFPAILSAGSSWLPQVPSSIPIAHKDNVGGFAGKALSHVDWTSQRTSCKPTHLGKTTLFKSFNLSFKYVLILKPVAHPTHSDMGDTDAEIDATLIQHRYQSHTTISSILHLSK